VHDGKHGCLDTDS